jgi:hypothetical protein
MSQDKSSIASQIIGEKRYKLLELFFIQERTFFRLLALFLVVAAITYPYPQIAMWVGFSLAAYSAIANDSIQSIGTFIASNSERKWWLLWLFIGGIFVVTVFYSWYYYGGDVSHERLLSKDSEGNLKFPEAENFKFLQLAAPIVLLLLTRLRMPVSTTFMLLSVFSANSKGILSVGQKSLIGYLIAFGVAMVVWFGLNFLIKRLLNGKMSSWWIVVQWLISGWLWSMWVMHDAANIAIFLPRSLSLTGFVVFAGVVFFGLGLLFYLRGDKIQSIVTEKSEVTDIRSASIIDFAYLIVLFVFKEMSNVPMSTTWVFIGLLGGRELAMRLSARVSNRQEAEGTMSLRTTILMVVKDLSYATIGLLVSITLAIAINDSLQQEILDWFN